MPHWRNKQCDTRGLRRRRASNDGTFNGCHDANYTDKQKRQAAHIGAGYEQHGASLREAEAWTWATVNKLSGGGKKSGSRRKKAD